MEITLESPADFDACARDRFLCNDAEQGGVRLTKSWLACSEQGVSSKASFVLSETNLAKKIIILPIAPAKDAELLLFHTKGSPAKPLLIRVNNAHTITNTGAADSSGCGWHSLHVPAGLLRAGTNELIFSNAGRLVPDTRSPCVGSEISHDAGRSWHQAQGEFMARLRLAGCPPNGCLMSEVIDAARSLAPNYAIGPWGEPQAITISCNYALVDLFSGKQPGTADEAESAAPISDIAFSWRAGHTHNFKPETWTAWQTNWPANPESRRFFQWRAIFATSQPATTPLLRRVALSIRGTKPAKLMHGLKLDQPLAQPGPVSSYPFEWERNSPKTQYFRERYKLADIIAATDSDLLRTTAIRRWSSSQWDKGWDMGRFQFVPPWDALLLLDMAPSNLCLGMCTHYATVYVQASAALGLLSRHVIIDHHCLAESFLDDQARWILQDPGPGPGPNSFPIGRIYTDTNGAPLNALDAHRCLSANETVMAAPDPADGNPTPYNKINLFARFGIPLRNNHLSVPEPAEEEHGQDHYHYDGYLWWADNLDDPLPQLRPFSMLSNRLFDFYPAINQVWADLIAVSNGVVRISLWSNMPNPAGFETRCKAAPASSTQQPLQGEWKQTAAEHDWALQPGCNILEVRCRNVFGKTSKPTRLAVTWAE